MAEIKKEEKGVSEEPKNDVFTAIQILHSIANDGDLCSSQCGSLPDLNYITETLTNMAEEHATLVHYLETVSLDRIKYYEQQSHMVSGFKNKILQVEQTCRSDGLRKLENELVRVKEISKELSRNKRYQKLLREDNVRLKGLVELVAKETKTITNLVLLYYNRRSKNKDAINIAYENVAKTDEKIAAEKTALVMEQEDWQGEELMLNLHMYEGQLNIQLEEDDVVLDEEVAVQRDEEETLLKEQLNKITETIRDLKVEFYTNVGIIRTQNKICESVAGNCSGAQTHGAVDDLEKWALQLENPAIYTDSDSSEKSEDHEEEKHIENLSEAENLMLMKFELPVVQQERDDLITADLHVLFQPTSTETLPHAHAVHPTDGAVFSADETFHPADETIFSANKTVHPAGMPHGHVPHHLDQVFGSYNNLDEAQHKVRTVKVAVANLQALISRKTIYKVLDQEARLNSETTKLKRALVMKTRKVDKLKDLLNDLNDETRRLQQNCDNHYNSLRDVVEREQTVKTQATAEHQQMTMTTATETTRTKILKQELTNIDRSLKKATAKAEIDIKDFTDDALNTKDEEEVITDYIQAEITRDLLLRHEVKFGKQERNLQETLRAEVVGQTEYLDKRIQALQGEYEKLTSLLDHEETQFDACYVYFASLQLESAIACSDLRYAVTQEQDHLAAWKSQVAAANSLIFEARKNIEMALDKMYIFTGNLKTDLLELNQALMAYKTMGKIFKSYAVYALDEAKFPAETSGYLMQAVRKVVEERPQIQAEVIRKQEIGRTITEMLLTFGLTSGKEYADFAAFLRQTDEHLKDLVQGSSNMAQFTELTTAQCHKFAALGERFTSHLLRKQATTPNNSDT